MNSTSDKPRFIFIDVLRGFTILLMFFFHFSFDLNYLGFIQVDIIRHPFWYFLPRLIVFLFFVAVGMSLTLAHKNKIKWDIFFKRLFKLFLLSSLISLVTYFIFPENWIYFGTLHSILVVSVLTLPFLKHPKAALILAILLFFPSIIWDKTIPWFEMAHPSFDYISPFPWVGACLIGIYATSKNIHKIYCAENSPIIKSLNFLGKHSLVIYLIHQPFFFGVLYVIKLVI